MKIEIEKHVVVWFKLLFEAHDSGFVWGFPNGESIWIKANRYTVAFFYGKATSFENKRVAAHIRAAGFKVVGI